MPDPAHTDLRHRLIRLAHERPEFRGTLLPLITASHDVEAGSYQEYVERKKKQGKPPMKKDEWEARTNGGQQGGTTPPKKKDAPKEDEKKDEGKAKKEPAKEKDTTPTPVDKKLGDLLGQWHSSGSDPIYAVSSNASGGKPVPKHVAEAALDKLTMMVENPEAHQISSADVKELTKAKKLLEKAVGGAKKDEPKKKVAPKSEKSYKKTYKPAVSKVMDAHGLTDDDAEQVKQFKGDKPSDGKPVPPAVLMQRFLAKAKPETKERMKGMSPQEFMAMLAAISDDEGGKTAFLRKEVIRLAHAHPEFRQDLLPLVQACDHTEGPMMGKYEEGKPADPTENMSEEDKKEWELNTLRHKDKFKQAEEDGEKKEAALRSRLIRLAHSNPNLRASILPLLSKSAGMAVVRKSVVISVRVLQHTVSADGKINLVGQMSLDFGGDIPPDAVRFTASVSVVKQSFVVLDFHTNKTVSGAGAEFLTNILRAALTEALASKGGMLIGDAGADVTIQAN